MSVAFVSFLALRTCPSFFFFFFNDTATTEIYTLSLHDALPILLAVVVEAERYPRRRSTLLSEGGRCAEEQPAGLESRSAREDRKSTRLNSSHGYISYAVFCLKKKKTKTTQQNNPTQTIVYKYYP